MKQSKRGDRKLGLAFSNKYVKPLSEMQSYPYELFERRDSFMSQNMPC